MDIIAEHTQALFDLMHPQQGPEALAEMYGDEATARIAMLVQMRSLHWLSDFLDISGVLTASGRGYITITAEERAVL